MLIRYVNVEEIDTVLTVTFAERPAEGGFLLNIMRVVPGAGNDGFDPEMEDYELATRDHLCEGGVQDWSLNDGELVLNLTSEAAFQLQVGQEHRFQLDISDGDLVRLQEALQIALSPVGFE